MVSMYVLCRRYEFNYKVHRVYIPFSCVVEVGQGAINTTKHSQTLIIEFDHRNAHLKSLPTTTATNTLS